MIRRTGMMFLALAVGVTGLTVAAHAEITVDAIAFWNSTSNPVIGTFDASTYDKLVVVVTGEHGFPNNAGGNCTSVTYDGVELTQAVNRDPVILSEDPYIVDQTYNDIWYLDDPGAVTSAGEIIATVSTRGNVTVFGLSGTAPGVGATAISEPKTASIDLTTTAPGSLVIASYGMGGNGNTARTEDITPDPPLTLASAQHNSSRHWDGHVTAYAMVPTAGPGTYSFSGGSQDVQDGAHVIIAEFLAAVTAQPGDFNGDAMVEQTDLNLLLSNWGGNSVPPEWTAPFDGLVDQNELNDLLANWGTGVVGAGELGATETVAPLVPEPATLGLLVLGGLAGLRRRR